MNNKPYTIDKENNQVIFHDGDKSIIVTKDIINQVWAKLNAAKAQPVEDFKFKYQIDPKRELAHTGTIEVIETTTSHTLAENDCKRALRNLPEPTYHQLFAGGFISVADDSDSDDGTA